MTDFLLRQYGNRTVFFLSCPVPVWVYSHSSWLNFKRMIWHVCTLSCILDLKWHSMNELWIVLLQLFWSENITIVGQIDRWRSRLLVFGGLLNLLIPFCTCYTITTFPPPPPPPPASFDCFGNPEWKCFHALRENN